MDNLHDVSEMLTKHKDRICFVFRDGVKTPYNNPDTIFELRDIIYVAPNKSQEEALLINIIPVKGVSNGINSTETN